MQDAAHGGDVAVCGRSDPLDHTVKRVGVGEDMVRRLPVAVFVCVAEARDPERGGVGERPAEVGALTNRPPDRVDDRGGLVAEQVFGERRVVRPSARVTTSGEQFRQFVGRFVA